MSGTIVTNYTAPPTIARFMASDAPVRLLLGPIGSGKSTGNIIEIARRARQQSPGRDGIRRTRWAIVRSTKQQLKDTTLKSWLEWFPDGVAGRWHESNMTYTLRFGDVVAEVMFRALDDPEDVRRLLSLELTGAFVNEARETPLEIITALRSRVGRYPSKKEGGPTWYGLIMDTNPPSTDHWVYEKFEQEKPAGWEIFKQPGSLDPAAENLENLPATYYQDLMEGADEDWINVHVHAKYGRSKAGLPVYEKTFVPDFHTRDELNVVGGTPVIIGMDFGRTPAAALYQRDARGRVLLQDELVSENMGLERFIDLKVRPLLADRYPGFRVAIAGDPAGWAKSQINEQSCADIIKAMGYVAVRPPTNDIAPRLGAVEKLLAQQIDGEAMFLINKSRCPTIVAGFEHGYRYKRKRDGQYEETPEKNRFSHPHDAVQYGALVVDAAGDLAKGLGAVRVVQQVDMRGWV
ncbi:terminase family protein [Candidimonas nitroreducens]|uniref:Terminase n=1 Tax=Candidimonas nitroreducens TaxID=683354 RepID=A0A225M3L1_9BURK|nr:terminase family protein [Candidimonas nitroreducens]OWT55262.1 terminase [Candidimonas nitroreducens]